jgi:hypothetical protein
MRTAGIWLVALAVASSMALAGAAAQSENCQVDLVEGDGTPSTTDFEEDETRTFTFVAENVGDLDARADVFLQDPAPGWSWPTRLPTLDLESNASTELTIDVTRLSGGASEAGFEIELTDIECSATGLSGIDSVQGTTNGPQSLSFAAADAPAAGDDGLPWPWLVFGVLVAGAVVGVPVAYQARRSRVEATVEESEKDVVAGRGTSFPVTLKNKGKEAIPVNLEVVDVQEGWSALTTLPDLELGARETRTVYMMVRAPPDAKPGDLCVAKLQVTPEGGSSTTVKTLARVDEAAGEAEDGPPAETEPEE